MDKVFEINNIIEKFLNEKENRKELISPIDLKKTFQEIKRTINISDNKTRLNYLTFLHELLKTTNFSDFEIKILFNDIILELVPFINDNDVNLT